MTSRTPPQCLSCAHWKSPLDRTDSDASKPEPTQTCDAYPLPSGIPDDVWWNRVDHRKRVSGDNGIQWESNGAEFPDWAMNLPKDE